MGNTLKKSADSLRDLAKGTTNQEAEPKQTQTSKNQPINVKKSRSEGDVLIGASFPRIVRRSLAQLQADPRNDGKTIKDLLAEALNDLFAKYGYPETAKIAERRGLD
jgi:hypothetical protein